MVKIKGIMEPWTGIFYGIEESQKWYKKHGKFFEDLGYKLELVFNEEI